MCIVLGSDDFCAAFFSSREAVGASECHRLLEVSSWIIWAFVGVWVVLEVSSHFILLLIILLYHFACFDFQIENNNFCFSQTKHCYKHKEPSEWDSHGDRSAQDSHMDHGNLGMVTYHHLWLLWLKHATSIKAYVA